ncbi:hypothetical protein LINGRAHAP2_LOCUS9224 [Linum grandiflorum]
MAVSSSISFSTVIHRLFHHHHRNNNLPLSFPASKFSIPNFSITRASSSSSSSSSSAKKKNKNKTPTSSSKKKNNSKKGKAGDDWKDLSSLSDFEIVDKAREEVKEVDDDYDDVGLRGSSAYLPPSTAAPLPKPPAGFAISESGRISVTSVSRIARIVDATNNSPLDCVVRRVFKSSRGDECMLLCPVDMPVHLLKSVNIDGWSAISDDEVEAILPDAAFALSKIDMHLVLSGMTTYSISVQARTLLLNPHTKNSLLAHCWAMVVLNCSGDGGNADGVPCEGVEVTDFHIDGAHYMMYTPSDPLLFIAIRDQDGVLQIADDDLLEDPAVITAIDEETEFNAYALVEEEAALNGSVMGKS